MKHQRSEGCAKNNEMSCCLSRRRVSNSSAPLTNSCRIQFRNKTSESSHARPEKSLLASKKSTALKVCTHLVTSLARAALAKYVSPSAKRPRCNMLPKLWRRRARRESHVTLCCKTKLKFWALSSTQISSISTSCFEMILTISSSQNTSQAVSCSNICRPSS